VIESFSVARQNLSDYPKIGTVGLIPGTGTLIVGQYVQTIRERGGTVEIAAIRDARQGASYAPTDVKS
jgi:plasmid stabilization system protein ParE